MLAPRAIDLVESVGFMDRTLSQSVRLTGTEQPLILGASSPKEDQVALASVLDW